jgi:hypothetical protein
MRTIKVVLENLNVTRFLEHSMDTKSNKERFVIYAEKWLEFLLTASEKLGCLHDGLRKYFYQLSRLLFLELNYVAVLPCSDSPSIVTLIIPTSSSVHQLDNFGTSQSIHSVSLNVSFVVLNTVVSTISSNKNLSKNAVNSGCCSAGNAQWL